MPNIRFSDELENLLVQNKSYSIKQLVDEFGEKSFAILMLLLMAVPALPIPTGGLTHVFEIIVMIIALEMIAGRQAIWLPKKFLNKKLSKKFLAGSLPKLISLIRRVEKLSRTRANGLLSSRNFSRLSGLFVLVFTISAFMAPPFSGLDTLPALGVVLIALSLLLQDLIIYIFGLIAGSIGILLIFLLGSLVLKFI